MLTSTITVDVLKIKELGRLKQHEKDAALQKASSESSPVNIAYPQTINRYTNEAV